MEGDLYGKASETLFGKIELETIEITSDDTLTEASREDFGHNSGSTANIECAFPFTPTVIVMVEDQVI